MLPEREPMLSAGEVAAYFSVDPKTVTRWAKRGLIHSIRTAGGHRRFPESEVLRIMEERRSPSSE